MAKDKKEAINLDDAVVNLEPTQDDFMGRRISHRNFARIVLWLVNKSRNSDFVYVSELSDYMKTTTTASHNTLNNLVKAGFLRKNWASANLVEYHFVKNSNKILVEKYLEQAKKTLEVNF